MHKSRHSEDYVPWKHQKVIYWVTHQSITVDTLHINFAFGAKIIWNWRPSKIHTIPLSGMLQRLEHLTCCHLKLFFTFKKEIFLQHTANNEVSALARLNFFDKLLIGRETRDSPFVRINGSIKRVEFRENWWGFHPWGTRKTVRNNECDQTRMEQASIKQGSTVYFNYKIMMNFLLKDLRFRDK